MQWKTILMAVLTVFLLAGCNNSLACQIMQNVYLNGEIMRLDGVIRMSAKKDLSGGNNIEGTLAFQELGDISGE